MIAVASWLCFKIPLMVLFSCVKFSGVPNAGYRHILLIFFQFASSDSLSYFSFNNFGLMNLLVCVAKYNRSVLSAFVISLPILHSRIMKRKEKFTQCFKWSYACVKQNMAHFYVTCESLANILISWVYVLGVYVWVHEAYTSSQNGAREQSFKILCEIFFSTPITTGSERTHLKIRVLFTEELPLGRMVIVCIFTTIPNIWFLILTIVLLHK